MSGYRFVIVQGTGAAAPAPPAPPVIAGSREALREQIRHAIQGVEISVQDAKAYQEQVKAAEQRVDAARKQMANARTPDQRGAAGQELGMATADLALLRVRGRDVVGVHATTQPPALPTDLIPPQAVDIAYGFFIMMAVMVVGWPLARAFGRRIERHGASPASADPAIAGQLQRIEQAVDAMSIEIERISESQRFMARLQSGGVPERSALATGGERL